MILPSSIVDPRFLCFFESVSPGESLTKELEKLGTVQVLEGGFTAGGLRVAFYSIGSTNVNHRFFTFFVPLHQPQCPLSPTPSSVPVFHAYFRPDATPHVPVRMSLPSESLLVGCTEP